MLSLQYLHMSIHYTQLQCMCVCVHVCVASFSFVFFFVDQRITTEGGREREAGWSGSLRLLLRLPHIGSGPVIWVITERPLI